jgi:hypothetical protein
LSKINSYLFLNTVAVEVLELVAVLGEVSTAIPSAVTLESFKRVGNYYGCYQLVPLPSNTIRGVYSHMFKMLIFKGYL